MGRQLEEEIALDICSYMNIDREEVSSNSRLYHDLGISGDDLADYLDHFSEIFKVNISFIDLNEYSPGEIGPWWLWSKAKRKYKELSVKDLAEFVMRAST